MAVEVNITINIGQDENHAWDIVDSASAVQSMTGWTLQWVLRRSLAGAASLTKATGGSGITIGNGSGTNDRATVAIADTDTIALAPGTYYYALRRNEAGSEVVLAYGKAKLQLLAAR